VIKVLLYPRLAKLPNIKIVMRVVFRMPGHHKFHVMQKLISKGVKRNKRLPNFCWNVVNAPRASRDDLFRTSEQVEVNPCHDIRTLHGITVSGSVHQIK